MPLQILVVDDEPSVLRLMQEVLIMMGAEPLSLGSAAEALQRVREGKFDGIVVDIVMPEISGLEFIRQVRRSEWNRKTPIVAVSGSHDPGTMEEALAAGATFFLHKPFDHKNLTRLLNSTRGSMLQERRRYARFSISMPVKCQAGSARFNAAGQDLSEGGVRIFTRTPVAEGTMLALSLTLPGQKAPFEASGRVVRSVEGMVSLQFGDLPAPARGQLRAFLGSQMERVLAL